MHKILANLSLVLLVTSFPNGLWAQDDFELPEDLKETPCPEGTIPDGKGFCIPEKNTNSAPTPGPAAKPAPAPAAKPTPAPVAKPSPAPVAKPAPAPAAKPTPEAKPTPATAAKPTPEPKPTPATAAKPAPTPEPKPTTAPVAKPAPAPGKKSPPLQKQRTGSEEKFTVQKKKPSDNTTNKHSLASGEKSAKTNAPKHKFVKGELSSFLGSSKLITKNNRVGLRLGWQQIDLVQYLTINPEIDLRFGDLSFGLGVPLALEMFDGNLKDGQDWTAGFDDMGAFRTEDWDEWQEYARIIRYLSYGHKEDHFFLNLSQVGSNSLGHGAIMRRYSVNIDPDSTRLAGQLDMYNDYAGFELMTNSVVSWDIFGVLGFIKPLSLFLDSDIARSFSIGFTYAADRAAPVLVATKQQDASSGSQPFYALGDAKPDVASDAFLHTMGVDMEIKVLKTEHLDIKPFVDFSWMMPQTPSGPGKNLDPEGGSGFTAGVLGRFNFGKETIHALRVIAEFRTFSSTYLPGYFDTFYEVQKYFAHQRYEQVGTQQCPGAISPNDQRICLPPTKFNEIFVQRKGLDRHLGFYAEFNYSIVNYLSLTLALEGSDAALGNNFLAHLEVPALDWLQFFVTFHQRSMGDLGDLFSNDSSDKILFAAARLHLLPFLFINFRYYHTWMLREGATDLNGDGLEDSYRLYLPHHAWMGDLELGWEF